MKNLRMLISGALAFVACMVIMISCKKEHSVATTAPVYKVNFVPAKTGNELLAIKADKNSNIIRTLDEFDFVVSTNSTPLSLLSKDDLQALRSGLVIKSTGVVSMNFTTISKKLTYDDFATVMTFFGLDVKNGYWGLSKNPEIIQQLAGTSNLKTNDDDEGFNPGDDTGFADHSGYYCSVALPHTCVKKSGYICLSDC